MTCGGMPGMVLLSTVGVPSGFTRPRESVVKKPPIAGPKPTQTMSTSMVWRGISGALVVSLMVGKGLGLARRDTMPRREPCLHHGGGNAIPPRLSFL